MNDFYAHIEPNIFYITENILGPVEQSSDYEQLLNNFNSQISEHCLCEKGCIPHECLCLLKSCNQQHTESFPDLQLIECNDRCSCSINCCNRIVQRGPIKGLEVKPNNKGFGLYTNHFISKWAFICEYAGEIITKTQALIRQRLNLEHGRMNYIFCLNEHFGENIVQSFVDPSIFGNIGRYINHSCQPNCYIVPVRCNNLVPKLAIFAGEDVSVGDELTYHYGSSDVNDTLTPENRIKCLCKMKNCKGFIPFHNY